MKIKIRDNTIYKATGIALAVHEPHHTYPYERGTVTHIDSLETLETAIQEYKDAKAEEDKKALREKHTKFKVGDIVRLTGVNWVNHHLRDTLQTVAWIDSYEMARISYNDYAICQSDKADWSATKIGEVTENE